MTKSPAHLFAPDPAGEQVFASDEHRRVVHFTRAGLGWPFRFSNTLFTSASTWHPPALPAASKGFRPVAQGTERTGSDLGFL